MAVIWFLCCTNRSEGVIRVLKGAFYWFRDVATEAAAAIRAGVKSMGLKFINFFGCKRRSFVLDMSRLTTGFARLFIFYLSWWLDNIRGRWFGGIGRVLREFGDLLGKFLFCRISSATCFSNAAIRSPCWANCASSWAIRRLYLFSRVGSTGHSLFCCQLCCRTFVALRLKKP